MFPYLHQLGLEWGWADPKQHFSNYAGFIGVRKNYQYGIPGTAANTLGTLGTNAATLGSVIDPNSGLLRAIVSVVQRLRGQPDLPFWQEPESAAAVLHSRPADHAEARLRRLSVSALHLRRQHAGKCAPYPVIGPNGTDQHRAAELCVQLVDSAVSRPAQYLLRSFRSPTSCRVRFWLTSSSTARISGRRRCCRRAYFTGRLSSSRRTCRRKAFSPLRTAAIAPPVKSIPTTQVGSKNTFQAGVIYDVRAALWRPLRLYVVHGVHRSGVYRDLRHHPSQSAVAASRTPTRGCCPTIIPAPSKAWKKISSRNRSAQQLRLSTGCGYLSSYFPKGVRFPYEHDVPTVGQQTYGLYVQDTVEMSVKWKTEVGLRLRRLQLPDSDRAGQSGHHLGRRPSAPARTPFRSVVRPDRADTIRVGFGHTLSVPLPSQLGANVSRVRSHV